jgi:hypothetical protein
VVGIEARGSPLLNKGGLESVPDQERVVFTVPDEHPELMGDGSLEGSTSSLSLDLPPLQLVLVWRHSRGQHSALRVEHFGFASRLLLRARNQPPKAIELKPGLHIISPESIVSCVRAGIEETEASREVDMVWTVGTMMWQRME